MLDLIKLDPFPSVAASSPVSLTTDELSNRTLVGLIFEQGGTFTKAQLENITIEVDGKTVIAQIDGDDLQDLNDYMGLSATSNYVGVWFGDPTALTVRGQLLGGLDFSMYQAPIQINADIGAATSPTLQCYALVAPAKVDTGMFSEAEAVMTRALVRTIIQPSAAVTKKGYQIALGAEAGAQIARIAFFHSNLTSVEFRKGGFVKHDDISDALNDYIQNEFARSPQSGLYVLDRAINGAMSSAEPTLQASGRPWSFNVNLTTSGSDTITAYADLLAPLPLL